MSQGWKCSDKTCQQVVLENEGYDLEKGPPFCPKCKQTTMRSRRQRKPVGMKCYLVDWINEEFDKEKFVCVLPGKKGQPLPDVRVVEYIRMTGEGMVQVRTQDGENFTVRPKRIVDVYTNDAAANALQDEIHAKSLARRSAAITPGA